MQPAVTRPKREVPLLGKVVFPQLVCCRLCATLRPGVPRARLTADPAPRGPTAAGRWALLLMPLAGNPGPLHFVC